MASLLIDLFWIDQVIDGIDFIPFSLDNQLSLGFVPSPDIFADGGGKCMELSSKHHRHGFLQSGSVHFITYQNPCPFLQMLVVVSPVSS